MVSGKLPRILKDITRETGAYYIPVQEEMRAYRDYLRRTFGIVRPLYPDGVHPNGWAQYPIAKALWERLNAPGSLLSKHDERRPSAPFKPIPVRASLNAKFLEEGDPIKVQLQSAEPVRVGISWSYGALRGKTSLSVASQGTQWVVPLRPEDLEVAPGRNRVLVFDLTSGAGRSLYILDLTGTRVWDLDEENAVHGDLPHDGSPKHGTWRISKHGRGLLLSGTVIDEDIQDAGRTPGGRDGVQLMLDLRQDSRFADLSFDEDMHLFCLNVQAEPRFGVGLVPLWGRGLSCAANAGACRTERQSHSSAVRPHSWHSSAVQRVPLPGGGRRPKIGDTAELCRQT